VERVADGGKTCWEGILAGDLADLVGTHGDYSEGVVVDCC
jgi:hypothetical protein